VVERNYDNDKRLETYVPVVSHLGKMLAHVNACVFSSQSPGRNVVYSVNSLAFLYSIASP